MGNKEESKITKVLVLNNWNKLSLRVILLFLITMAATFLPEIEPMREFFGDVKYGDGYRHDFLDEHWDWGYRHYLYLWMGIVLFVIQVIRIINWVDNKEFKY